MKDEKGKPLTYWGGLYEDNIKKLAEEVYGKNVNPDYEEGYVDGYNKAKEHPNKYDIIDSDIATIEALHDLLLDAHGYHLDFIALKRARELTKKMYAFLYK